MTSVFWSQLTNQQTVNLSKKSLDELPSGVSQCDDLESLILEFNSLLDLPKDLGELRGLKVLNLNHNALASLPRCIFQLHTLEELWASNNQIETVHKDIGNLCDLTHLDLSHNKLITLTAGVGFLNRLKYINLSNNQLQSIPHELTAICGLVEINVSNNKVKKLPCARNLIHLKVLTANNNLVKQLPDLSQCRELVCVDFSHNQIEEIESASLNCQPFLKEVYLHHNKLKSLPDDLSSLASLLVLDISANKLNLLPPYFCDFPILQTLRIANNPWKEIPVHYAKTDTVRLLTYLRERANLETAPETNDTEEEMSPSPTPRDLAMTRFSVAHLRRSGGLVHTCADEKVPESVWDNAITAKVVVLNLSHCKSPLSQRVVELSEWLMELHLVDAGLTELPVCVGKLKELQVLVLDQNSLTNLCPQLATCKYMRELSLNCNKLKQVPSVVFELTLLRVLTMNNNKLSELPVENRLDQLSRLDVLDISNNEITQLPPELGLMTHLKSLIVTGNRFRQPSYQVLAKGTEHLLAYLRNKLPEEEKEEAKDVSLPSSVSYFIS